MRDWRLFGLVVVLALLGQPATAGTRCETDANGSIHCEQKSDLQPLPPITPPPLGALSGAVNGPTAFFTGRQQQVQTVTNQWVWSCEYDYNGQLFTRLFRNGCPATAPVE